MVKIQDWLDQITDSAYRHVGESAKMEEFLQDVEPFLHGLASHIWIMYKNKAGGK